VITNVIAAPRVAIAFNGMHSTIKHLLSSLAKTFEQIAAL
jgi:hypothetical protein